MTENERAVHRAALEQAAGDLRELCEDVAPPMRTQEYVAHFCGRNAGDAQALAQRAPRRATFYAAIERYQNAFEALRGQLAAAGYVPREVASIEKESTRFAQLRQEIGAAAGE
ncbi:hypothetical protein [Specibacter sp. RAF43]|uniref:hypothetical protein n=1 Tax=Specibacter sp. RAF43 TaxID=3233057 RepID=UPI003F98EC31